MPTILRRGADASRRALSRALRPAAGASRARAGRPARAGRARRRSAAARRRRAAPASSSSNARSSSPASSAASASASVPCSVEADPRAQAVGLEAVGERLEHRVGLLELAAGDQHPRERHRGVGARRARARPRAAATPRRPRPRARPPRSGRARRRTRAPPGRGCGADELVDDRAVAERLDRRDALDAERLREARVGVGVDLREHDLALARRRLGLEQRAELAARPAPGGPEVDDHGGRARALDHLGVEGRLADVDHGHAINPTRSLDIARWSGRPSRASRPSARATGPFVVGLHGLTATRRYVLMGARTVERSGRRSSSTTRAATALPSPPPTATTPTRRWRPTSAASSTRGRERRGADRRVDGRPHRRALRARAPRARPRAAARHAGLRPGRVPRRGWRAGTRSPTACAAAASTASSPPTTSRGWRPPGASAAERGLRQRMSAPRAPARRRRRARGACRARGRSRAGRRCGASAPRRSSSGSRDDADPEHPLAVARAYAQAIPGARLEVEDEGASPIAWQGGRLSRLLLEHLSSDAAGCGRTRHSSFGTLRILSVLASGNATGVGVFAAIAAGAVSFLSPCVLPLVPGYLSTVVGVSPSELATAGARRVLVPSLLFVRELLADLHPPRARRDRDRLGADPEQDHARPRRGRDHRRARRRLRARRRSSRRSVASGTSSGCSSAPGAAARWSPGRPSRSPGRRAWARRSRRSSRSRARRTPRRTARCCSPSTRRDWRSRSSRPRWPSGA